jgi:hypothetical protein
MKTPFTVSTLLFLCLTISTVSQTLPIKQQIDSLRVKMNVLQKERDSALVRVNDIQAKLDSTESELSSLLVNSAERASNTVFLELLGAGGIGSINYDHRFDRNWSWRLGIGYMNWYQYNGALGTGTYVLNGGTAAINTDFVGSFTIPFMLTYFTDEGGSPGHFELGAGIVPWFGETVVSTYVANRDPNGKPISVGYQEMSRTGSLAVYVPLNVAYRYQPIEGGFHFRIGFMALLGGNFGFLPWAKISLGWTFQ